jgi:threonine dehydrogenase-like Zn-dependent dehydrogenase
MRALVADTAIPRALFTVAASRVRHDAAWSMRAGVLNMRDIPTPSLPGPGWALIRPTLSGICGSDLKLLHVTGFSPVLTAFNGNTRAVPGHEVTGVVTRTLGTTRVREGDRVIVEPILRCAHKGLADCARCRAGEYHLCENLAAEGSLHCSGQGIGFGERVGGGWSEGVVAPEDMLYPADGISEERAVLAEPASVALHAALRWERNGDTAVVIGPGTLGLLVMMALHRLHPDLDISAVGPPSANPSGPPPFGGEQSRRAGASRMWVGPPETVLQQAAQLTNAHLLKPRIGRTPVLDGGVDLVIDCVGSAQTLDMAMRMLRPRGTLVMLGTAGRQKVDWSLVWWRELTVLGTVVYATEKDGRRTFDILREWLADADYPVDMILTHRFPLDRYAEALQTASAGPRARAIRVALEIPPAA